jgi:hypothetical protein
MKKRVEIKIGIEAGLPAVHAATAYTRTDTNEVILTTPAPAVLDYVAQGNRAKAVLKKLGWTNVKFEWQSKPSYYANHVLSAIPPQ